MRPVCLNLSISCGSDIEIAVIIVLDLIGAVTRPFGSEEPALGDVVLIVIIPPIVGLSNRIMNHQDMQSPANTDIDGAQTVTWALSATGSNRYADHTGP